MGLVLRQILYTKAVQTSFYSADDDSESLPAHMANGVGSSTSTGPPRESEDAMRRRIIKELEEEKAALDKQIEEERATLAKEAEQDRLRGQLVYPLLLLAARLTLLGSPVAELTEEQKSQIYSAPTFLEFVESSSKIVQRALSDGYDYCKDYATGGPGDMYVGSGAGAIIAS